MTNRRLCVRKDFSALWKTARRGGGPLEQVTLEITSLLAADNTEYRTATAFSVSLLMLTSDLIKLLKEASGTPDS